MFVPNFRSHKNNGIHMVDADVLKIIEQSAHEVLEWVGFGTIVGLAAKALMPGRDPGGAIVTVLLGIGGCVFGFGMLSFFTTEQRINTISLIGFAVGTGGAFVLLLLYRLLAGKWLKEGEDRLPWTGNQAAP
ncbi:MAG: GlsB/YeaQ/YmgE family stress response membrane protein [Planctomycetia bacterium]|nr:GlsB/YeaQ/YmgE family stress response membrane protein [Planctomycetia bacterium]